MGILQMEEKKDVNIKLSNTCKSFSLIKLKINREAYRAICENN
jgi:hypothetical protein